MSINKDSIFFKITLFFVVMLITANTIIYNGYQITKQQQIDMLINYYMKTMHQVKEDIFRKEIMGKRFNKDKEFFRPPPPLRHLNQKEKGRFPKPPKLSDEVINKELKIYDLEISKIDLESVANGGKMLYFDKKLKIFEYKNDKYFFFDSHVQPLFIKDNLHKNKNTYTLIVMGLLLNIAFILFFLFLIYKLKPLNDLKNSIQRFARGELNIDTSCNGKDEICSLSNEFNNAITQIRELSESRNLFLRNIMHEFKTPITKGNLVSDMMPESKHKESLKRAFSRLEYLLGEFAKIEQLTSRNIKLQKDNYRVIDIIDQSLDILFIHRDRVVLNINHNLMINVDFQLFAIALKNLIDNGIKYGKSDVIIDIDNDKISIRTKGDKLQREFKEYLKPFNREYETSNLSLGLGLYIVSNILKAHELSLSYKYENGENIFYINF